MKKNVRVVVALASSLALVLSLVGCSGSSTAATVNGEKLSEDTITAAIESVRTANGYDDDADWATALSSSSLTPETLRESYIDSYTQQMVIRQVAEDAGITVSADDVNATIEETRTSYGYDDDTEWAEMLAASGFPTEDDYYYVVESQTLLDALYEAEVAQPEPTDDELTTMASYYSGEKASHILVADEATANEILATIQGSDDVAAAFAAAEAEYNTDTTEGDDAGNLGWTTVNYTLFYSTLTNCQTALADMEVGDVTVVSEDDGYHILYCTDKYTAPDTIDLTAIPTDLYDAIYAAAQEDAWSTACEDYLSGLVDEADIVVNDMPDGLSYDVDMSLAESTDTSATSTTSTTSTTSASDTTYYRDGTGTYYLDSDGNAVYVTVVDATDTTTTTE